MKNLVQAVSFAAALALIALSNSANAQTVAVNGLGSSALFLEAGLGASTGTTPIGATCVWTTKSDLGTNTVTATDTSVTHSISTASKDKGNAWVAWTPSSQPATTASCADSAVSSSTQIYAYLQTDSVVGNRCLFNAQITDPTLHTPECGISYPTGGPSSESLIYPASDSSRTEFALPPTVAAALNLALVNAAGTDIRPEDAWFATKRALTACGTAVVSGSQYLGLGYTNGSDITSSFGTSPSVFHVIDFSLPSAPSVGYSVTAVGATPILVVVNGQSTTSGFGTRTFNNITSANLALFLNGTSTKTDQVNNASATTGNSVTTLIREPLSGTFNTMEYNVPNRTASGFQTSQETGNCPLVNPLIGTRKRAIGTGQELSEVIDTANNDVLGYAFWSVANFKGFTSTAAPNARYLTVDGIDPLISISGNHNGIIPLSGSSDMTNVSLANLNNAGSLNTNYPIWSLLRFVNVGTTPSTALTSLAAATQNFVSFGSATSRPDFIIAPNLNVVRSHFVPPVPSTQPTPAANGRVGTISSTSHCTNPEVGGDVGGVVLSLTADSTTCITQPTGSKTGTTGSRR
jgi:hypothetical protein